MKTRNGFVSNSSTSSFLMVGFEVSEEKLHELLVPKYWAEEEFEGAKKEKFSYYSCPRIGKFDEKDPLGNIEVFSTDIRSDEHYDNENYDLMLGYFSSDEYLSPHSFKEIMRKVQAAREMLNISKDEEPKVYTDARYC